MTSQEFEEFSDQDNRLGEVISGYLKVVEAGGLPNRQELLDAHPEMASELADFFADRDHMERLASPLRLATHSIAEAADLTGSRIGDYEIVEQIGQGGMGVVFAARQDRPRRLVALKIIHAGSWTMRQRLERFREESDILARLRHPNIVRVYEVGEHEGRPYFTMDLAAGNLAQKLALSPLSPQDAGVLVNTLALAVRSAHDQGVVHRDLKPSNILLTSEGIPLIGDFGLAKQLQNGSSELQADELTQTGAILGTPSYMAPEQTTGHNKDVGPPVDVYALGAILYECLTGRAPFKSATPLETLQQIQTRDPVPPIRLQPSVPFDLQTICLKCLEKDWRRRYTSAQTLADDLERFLAGRPIAARPVGVWERAWKWARRNPAAAALTAVSGGSIVAFIVGALVHDRQMSTALGKAEANEARAIEQHHLAEVRYHAARESLGRILDRLDAPRIAGVPRLKEVRQEMQEDLLTFYQSLLENADSPDPAVRFDSAFAFEQTGRIQFMLGRPGPAEEKFRRALTLMQELPEEYRTRPEARNLVALCQNQLAFMASDHNRSEEAEQRYRESFQLLEGLAREQPTDPKAQNGLATAEHNLGVSCQLRQRLLEAEKHYLRSVAIRTELVRDHPEDQNYASSLAETRGNLGLVYVGLGRSAEGAAEYEKAAAVLKSLADAHPEVPVYALSLAGTYGNWGNLLKETGKLADALKVLTLAVDLAEKSLAQEPNYAVARARAFASHAARAQVNQNLTHWQNSIDDWDRVIALTDSSTHWRWRLARAGILSQAGRMEAAAAEAELLEKAAGITDEAQYNLACFNCVLLKSIAPGQNSAAAERYATRAMELLKRLQSAGHFRQPAEAKLLNTDDDLSPLRGRSDFQRLLKEVNTKN